LTWKFALADNRVAMPDSMATARSSVEEAITDDKGV
jgi:hypothetical protein